MEVKSKLDLKHKYGDKNQDIEHIAYEQVPYVLRLFLSYHIGQS